MDPCSSRLAVRSWYANMHVFNNWLEYIMHVCYEYCCVNHYGVHCFFQLMHMQEVDKQLKLVCEKFISDVSTSLVTPLKTILSKFDVIFVLASKDNLDIGTLVHQQPFAAAGIG